MKVKLLIPRTGVGRAGDVVDYENDVAKRHIDLGLVEPAGAKTVRAEDNTTNQGGSNVAAPLSRAAATSSDESGPTEDKPKRRRSRGS